MEEMLIIYQLIICLSCECRKAKRSYQLLPESPLRWLCKDFGDRVVGLGISGTISYSIDGAPSTVVSALFFSRLPSP